MKELAIYGGGGFAREVAWLTEVINETDEQFFPVIFIDDDESKQGLLLNDIPVLSFPEARRSFPDGHIICAIGSPQTRQQIIRKVESAGLKFATLIHPRTEMSKFMEIGEGTVICAGNILTTNIKIGKHVHLNLDCTIGHDVILGDFTTLAPGVHVSGWVHFGQRVYVGTGAVIINGTEHKPLVIGDDAVIGAGACVVKPVESGTTVVGVPAKPLSR